MMKFYLAPLEGITGYVFRSVWHSFYGGMDKYFTPFIAPNETRGIGPKELRDILPEHNKGMNVVPQILTNNAEHFLRAAKELADYGYKEVNLNLGCPSGTVVSKNKGAGFLALREELERFLDKVINGTEICISVKTRIGKESADEFAALLPIFNRYPISELIIHPRIRTDYYKNKPNMEVFQMAVREGKAPICYNGDIFNKAVYEEFVKTNPSVEAVMLGRGILLDPGLLGQIKGGGSTQKASVKDFHDELYHAYQEVLFGERVVLFKMKELWSYLHHLFSDSDKQWKKIRKANRFCEYEEAVDRLFVQSEIVMVETFAG